MARVFNGSSQYLSASSTLLTNEPIDLIAYQNSDTITQNNTVLGLFNTGGANGVYAIYAEGASGGDPFAAIKKNDAGSAGGAARTGVGFSAATWYVIAGTFISNTSRSVFLNGANKVNETTSMTDPTPDVIAIGANVASSVSVYNDGLVAEAYVLDVNMTDAQHALVGKGISPFWIVPGNNVRAWYPLNSNNSNRVRNGYPNLTATGSPTNGTHPARVFRPRINGVITV